MLQRKGSSCEFTDSGEGTLPARASSNTTWDKICRWLTSQKARDLRMPWLMDEPNKDLSTRVPEDVGVKRCLGVSLAFIGVKG